MNVYEYEHEKKMIKASCRAQFGLIMAGLAGLLIGSRFAMKTLDIDTTKKPWNMAQMPLYVGIGAVTVYYAMKEPEKLNELRKKFDKSQEGDNKDF